MNKFVKLIDGMWKKKSKEKGIRELVFIYNVMPEKLKENNRVVLAFVSVLEELIRIDKIRKRRKNAKYMYSEYCTAFYYKGELVFWDEIEDEELKILKNVTRIEAEKIMDDWLKNAPKGVVCEILD